MFGLVFAILVKELVVYNYFRYGDCKVRKLIYEKRLQSWEKTNQFDRNIFLFWKKVGVSGKSTNLLLFYYI